jgi:dihydrofolate reductase
MKMRRGPGQLIVPPTTMTEGAAMSRVRVHNFSISLDGFATGDGQALDAPFGHAGHRLHEWMFATGFGRDLLAELGASRADMLGGTGGTEGVDHVMAERHGPGIGAEIMGAGKFGPPGWQDNPEWRGWWGDNPPFHTPTYVLTHRPRPPLEMEGGTTFHFLDAAPADALAVAREVADGQDVRIGGGPTMLREFLAAGLVDHLHVVQVPILLGRGVRLWDGLEALEEQYDVEAVSTPSGVTHLTFTR